MGPTMAAKQQQIEDDLDIDSWEEIEGTDVLEQKLNQLIMPSFADRSVNGNVGPINVIVTGEDALRSQYVPTEPAVKILKRPTKEPQNINDNRRAVPKKTLQQREQEYAEARLRIMGESGIEKTEERISIAKPKLLEQDNVVRMPKGPDGAGFKLRR